MHSVPESTIYKVYPDGTSHLIQEKELNADGNILVERQYISRVDQNDSTGYFHSHWHEFRYLYNSEGRLHEKVTYRHGNNDTLILETKEMYEWHDDTAIHSLAYVQHGTSVLGEFKEVDRTVYDALGRVTYSKVHDGLELQYIDGERVRVPKYVAKKFVYNGGQLESVEITNRDDYSNIEAFGKAILSNSILKRTYRSDGSLLSDTVLSMEFDLSVYEAQVWNFNQYNELVTIQRCDGNPRVEEVYWTTSNIREGREYLLPPLDFDPMVEVKARMEDPIVTIENWTWQKEEILKSTYTYGDFNRIASRVDEFAPPTYPSDKVSRTTEYSYSFGGLLQKQTSETTLMDGTVVKEVVDYDRYEDGSLRWKREWTDDLITSSTTLSPTGMYLYSYTAKRLNDSTVTGSVVNYDLSLGLKEAGLVHHKNGEFTQGTIVIKNDDGKVIRFFDEEELNLDAQFYYSENPAAEGEMVVSTHRTISHSTVPESMNERDVYTLQYGKGYSFQTLLKSPFVPEFTLP